MAQTLVHRDGERLRGLLEEGKAFGELDAHLDSEVSVILFFVTIQGLVMQSLLVGDLGRIRHDAPIVFAIYLVSASLFL